ncbi:RNA-directed DNA polymerase (reverse transcriptase)-related family protein [Rhynchospora pubera]|uniref:RNA-directed DNA polymerase (Reverse transcriptase)-related family protein n=1 Tax=Rhynchospora pubera TaxID=906938 RepID=A0AAV8DJH1_9POAL|nr:RNA-directed DNA polymerase (reverse transcriptase)-related family protein [Rhynchospora pubera]
MALIPTLQEIKEVLWTMGLDRAPGPDGLTVRFLKSMWHVMSHDIAQKIRWAFISGQIPHEWTDCYIALIPKIDCPEKPSHYRPISVCSVLYRLTMKIMATRLRKHMPNIISPTQTAFVRGRSIHDNVILLREVLHSFRSSNFKAKAFALKLDLFKAFDTVEWRCIREVLQAINMPQNIVNLIYSAMSSAKFTIKLNGVKGDGFFTATRGLRQGCPLSPYLFILATEILSKLLNQAVQDSEIEGIQLSPGATQITHALYADDLIVSGNVQLQEIQTLRGLLQQFQAITGLKENPEKSHVWFSHATKPEDRDRILNVFSVKCAPEETSYLGCPISTKRYRVRHFQDLKERILNRISGWKLNNLSFAGRVELLRAVLQSIPMHVMATQQLPKQVLHQLTSTFKKFIWGKVGHDRYMAFLSWDKLCSTFQNGGLNLRDIYSLNTAWLMKTIFSFLSNNQALWVKILQGKYCSGNGFWNSNIKKGDSELWGTFHKLKHLIKDDLKWAIGSGSNIPALGQPWYPNWENDKHSTPLALNLKVRDLLNPQTHQWNLDSHTNLFQPTSIHQILSLPNIPSQDTSTPDKLVWTVSKNVHFILKLAYLKLTNPLPQIQPDPLWGHIWNIRDLIPKVRTFIWKAARGALPTMHELSKRIGRISPMCPRCHEENETMHHLLFICNASRATWYLSPFNLRTEYLPLQLREVLLQVTATLQDGHLQLFCYIMWSLWKSRNAVIFNAQQENPKSILAQALALQSARPKSNDSTQIAEQLEPPMNITIQPQVNSLWLVDASWDTQQRAAIGIAVYCNRGKLQ